MWRCIYKKGKKIGTIFPTEGTKDFSNKNVSNTQSRSYYETICEEHLIEYETCYHTGYDMGEGLIETSEECFYDYAFEEVCYNQLVEEDTTIISNLIF